MLQITIKFVIATKSLIVCGSKHDNKPTKEERP